MTPRRPRCLPAGHAQSDVLPIPEFVTAVLHGQEYDGHRIPLFQVMAGWGATLRVRVKVLIRDRVMGINGDRVRVRVSTRVRVRAQCD